MKQLVVLAVVLSLVATQTWNPDGYLTYCPCMGRLGNQMDHFLGALRFSHDLGRTLVLPRIVEYKGRDRHFPKFSSLFQVEPLQEYTNVLEMDEFMRLAAFHWPQDQRTAFCYGLPGASCAMRRGQPSSDYWDEHQLNFTSSLASQRILVSNPLSVRSLYPASRHPVIAMQGMSPFPVTAENRHLQAYLKLEPSLQQRAELFIRESKKGTSGGLLGLHVRQGSDWAKACAGALGRHSYMESPQCMEDRPDEVITQEICLPNLQHIVQVVLSLVAVHDIGVVFVATDTDAKKTRQDIESRLPSDLGLKVVAVDASSSSVYMDVAVLQNAEHFLGNCVSSLTGLVKRHRDAVGLPSSFFGMPMIQHDARDSAKPEL